MRSRSLVVTLLVALLLPATAFAVCSTAAAGSPQWQMQGRDGKRSGRSPWVGSQTGTKHWVVDLGSTIRSDPVIGADGSVYLMCDDARVYAVDGSTGAMQWSAETSNAAWPSLAVSADRVFAVGGDVYAFSATGGALVWRRDCSSSRTPFGSLLLDASGTLYVAGDHDLYALDPVDGAVKWKASSNDVWHWWLAPAVSNNGSVITAIDWGPVLAFDPLTGARKWESTAVPHGAEYLSTRAPHIGPDGTIYVGQEDGYYYSLYALKPDGTKRWVRRFDRVSASAELAVARDGTIYLASSFGGVYALRPSDGRTKWRRSIGGSMECAPSVGADGLIYVGGNDNYIRALRPSNGEVKWSRDLGGDVKATPVIGSNGLVYAAAGSKLWALDSHIIPRVVLCGRRSIQLGHMYNLKGRVSPTVTPGTVQVVWKRHYSGRYRPVRTMQRRIAGGAFSADYKPTRRGRWRVSVSYTGGFKAPVNYDSSITVNRSFTVE